MQVASTASVAAALLPAALVAGLLLFTSSHADAQQPARPPMSFFVTSTRIGNGGSLGGLAGADKHCQTLATAAGAVKKTWRAYLSTQGPGSVNARDRIGKGPWFNAQGARIALDVGDLHGNTLEQARRGNNLTRATAITEKGEPVPGFPAFGDILPQHDILTGSQLDGTAFPPGEDHTCRNWTSNSPEDSWQSGHHDRTGGPIGGNTSWNSAHLVKDCSEKRLAREGGRLYCFAID